MSTISIIFWQQSQSSKKEMLITADSLLESPNTPLPEEVRQKKVAVMVFDNQTNSEDLDPLGLMANDWITRGLLEVNKGKVINAANVRNNLTLASIGGGANPEFAKATGADILIQGRYYLAEDQIIIYSDIIDAYRGTIIYGLDHIKGDKDKALELIEELTQKLIDSGLQPE